MLKSSATPIPRLTLHAEGPASLVLRPDHLRVEINVWVLDLEVNRAIALIEPAIEAAMRELTGVLPGARVLLRGLELRRNVDKTSRANHELAAVACDGHIHVPLAAEASYWPRAHAVASLHATLAAAAAAGSKLKHPLHLGFGPALALVDDPEQHRLPLISRWLARARELATQAQAQNLCGALHLGECTVPGPVTQHPRSLEEVELRLALDAPLIATPADE
ncbi:MAG TPA: hypothetical protein VGB85_00950 [Nannocystis sp.]|jgi:hypothetical protein